MTSIIPAPGTAGAELARLWLRVYTIGLPAASRARRQQQLESDLWEHEVDRLSEGVPPSMVGTEVLGRMVRGMPADILWRFQMEGPKMELKIPFERVTGLLLLTLVVLVPVSGAISGYDTARDGWAGELRRLGDMASWQINLNILFQVLCGLSLIGAGAAFYLALQSRARVLTTFSAFGMTAAGVLTLAASATYAAVATLADDFAAGRGGDDVLTTARAFAISMDGLVRSATVSLALSVYALALIGYRHHLVPRWLGSLALLSFASFALAGITEAASDSDGAWLFLMGGLALLLLWLIVAGMCLLLGYQRPLEQAQSPTGVPTTQRSSS